MYSIKAYYRKKAKINVIARNINTDSYDDAMELFETYLRREKITDNDIVNYSVVKYIVCEHCSNSIKLESTVNPCSCGAVYDSFGDEIVASR